jgi:hypothetical protein
LGHAGEPSASKWANRHFLIGVDHDLKALKKFAIKILKNWLTLLAKHSWKKLKGGGVSLLYFPNQLQSHFLAVGLN